MMGDDLVSRIHKLGAAAFQERGGENKTGGVRRGGLKNLESGFDAATLDAFASYYGEPGGTRYPALASVTAPFLPLGTGHKTLSPLPNQSNSHLIKNNNCPPQYHMHTCHSNYQTRRFEMVLSTTKGMVRLQRILCYLAQTETIKIVHRFRVDAHPPIKTRTARFACLHQVIRGSIEVPYSSSSSLPPAGVCRWQQGFLL